MNDYQVRLYLPNDLTVGPAANTYVKAYNVSDAAKFALRFYLDEHRPTDRYFSYIVFAFDVRKPMFSSKVVITDDFEVTGVSEMLYEVFVECGI